MSRFLKTISIALGLVALVAVAPGFAQNHTIPYRNARFGYKLELPPAMLVVNRASDGSGVTWQTGSFRILVSGVNNPYAIKPHEYYEKIQELAKGRVVEESEGNIDGGHSGYWHQILYTKDSRRVHQKTFIAGQAINIIEVSYPYRLRKQKESVAQRILDSFQPGSLTELH